MPTLGSIIHTARTGLMVQQRALNVTAHNIANAGTDGYTRQRVDMVANPAVTKPDGIYGTGVGVANVVQIRDPFLDGVFYRELSSATQHEARSSVLGRIEGVMNEPGDLGLAASLDMFHSAWSDLATNPTSSTARSVVRQTGAVVGQRLNDLASQLDGLRQELGASLRAAASAATTLTSDIASLNRQIVSAEAGGASANDLRDFRSGKLAQLADLVPAQVTERADGSVGVHVDGVSIIDGALGLPLEARVAGGTYSLAVVGRASTLPQSGGRVGGLLQVLNTDLPDVVQRIDALASALVTEVNAAHAAGTNPAGAIGVSFFDPLGTTAGTISLSSAVLASTTAIAAGSPDAGGNYQAGANDVAMTLSGLRDTSVGSLGVTMREHYQTLVSDVGQAVRSSIDAADTHRALAENADLRRMSLSGVSIDEELVNMIEFQTAYQAAARVITTADEMLQSLLSI